MNHYSYWTWQSITSKYHVLQQATMHITEVLSFLVCPEHIEYIFS